MKIRMNKDYRKLFTLEDVDRAKAIISQEKETDATPNEYAEYAIREALKGTDDYLIEVLKASIETAKNCRAWNAYNNESADMDAWIEATAKTREGFIEIGAYLSDVWQTGATAYKQHMYIRYYTFTEI